jgi:hypothetical protein
VKEASSQRRSKRQIYTLTPLGVKASCGHGSVGTTIPIFIGPLSEVKSQNKGANEMFDLNIF